jgi:hypothetical protein
MTAPVLDLGAVVQRCKRKRTRIMLAIDSDVVCYETVTVMATQVLHNAHSFVFICD